METTLLYWTFLASCIVLVAMIHCFFLKKEKRSQRISKEWHDTDKAVTKYIADFHSKINSDLNHTISSSLEEIDMFNPYETGTYKKLLRKRNKAWIAYVERNHFLIDKGDLIVLLKEIKDDEVLSERVMRLISRN
jgi:hypothetical protein